ncbi:unnamed protein product (macronuclear) [Paramecium tetraurelia]|uniref:Replication protein A C-terminal domain-containing protein n=1 Tax=Paramecium tetraurelia TaxID=5888 RepID=A0CYC5_PARTE|nr:uncharacterized protein GSPATT00011392001 [Paramecium tetraurelia]CAK75792.1 unnamed protein product [Paramecium tetraurelia]|eukprot:XP_001443189.1 hypothetical protein (macronuclear) [Paramecium tetraurelia strain d4-2]
MYSKQKGTIDVSNKQEQIVPLNIRMMKQIKVSTCEKQAVLEKITITYINLITRKSNCIQQQKKGTIIINDDTGYLSLSMNLIQEFDQNLFNRINSDHSNLHYYNFILKTRVFKHEVFFDIQTIQQVNQSAMITYQIIKILAWARLQEGQKMQIHPRAENEEDEQILIEVSNLNEDILTFLGQNLKQGKSLNEIVDHFKALNNIEPQDIKKSITLLLKDGKIKNEGEIFHQVIHL